MSRTNLIQARDLADRLGEDNLRVLDATAFQQFPDDGGEPRIETGWANFTAGHIPGAAHADLVHELSDPDAPLRFTAPTAARFAAGVGRLGVGPDSYVVVYDTTALMWSTRLWWLFRLFGFDRVSVLDGGYPAWLAAGRPVETGVGVDRGPAHFTARLRPELIASTEEVAAAQREGAACVISASRPDVFGGTYKSALLRSGHIPGTTNVPSSSVLSPDGTFRAEDELRELFRASGALDRQRVITYCGGGISATIDAFALGLLGRLDVAVYDGSMHAWSADLSRPVEV
jgi:thiosulfate/3-mercaptopyruvate sulfurtransferase